MMAQQMLSVCSWNINGVNTKLHSGSRQNKLSINEVFEKLQYDIIALQETHANSETDISLYN